jgi:hypothetical protein
MHPDIPPYIYIIFTAATAIGVLMQACILLGMFIGLRRLQGRVENILNHLSEHALPLIASSKVTLEELSPKLKIISNNLVDVTETLKHESRTIKVSVDDVLEKTRVQTARVDEMVSGTLDGISHASAVIQHGIEVPLRQLNGILNGFRAGFDVLRSKRPVPPVDPIVSVEEPVIIVIEEELAGKPIL